MDFKLDERIQRVEHMLAIREPRILSETRRGPIYNWEGAFCWQTNMHPMMELGQGPDGYRCCLVPSSNLHTWDLTRYEGNFGRGRYPEGASGDAFPCVNCIPKLELFTEYFCHGKYFCQDCLPRHMHKCICDAKCCHFDSINQRFDWKIYGQCEHYITAGNADIAVEEVHPPAITWQLPVEFDNDNGPDEVIDYGSDYSNEPVSPNHATDSDNYLKPCFCIEPTKYFCSVACLKTVTHEEGQPCLVIGFDMNRAILEHACRNGPRRCRSDDW